MEEIGNLMHGFGVALTLANVGFMFVGITLGVLIGVLPGLGGANGIAILLPLTLNVVYLVPGVGMLTFAGDKATARAFGALYRQHPTKFPADAQEARYEERIAHAYPIHPEVFDRLYEDWSTLDKFQRTRGVLQYMAIVIHRLWDSRDKDPLIMPGSLPLDDALVRNKSLRFGDYDWRKGRPAR